MTEYDKTPALNFVLANDNEIIIYFENGEIKSLNQSKLINDKHTKEIKKSEIWKSVKNDKFSIYFTKYKLFNEPYSIGHDTIYDLSIPFSQMDKIIKGLRIYKGFTQKDLAKKLNVKTSELSLIEQGRNTNLKLISRILSVLI